MGILKHIRKTNEVVRKQSDHIQWRKLAVTILGLIGLSFGLTYLFQDIVAKLHLPLYGFAWLAYLTVFLSSLAANLTIIVPVPIGLSIMIAAATVWNPVLVALVAAVGASIGELSAYLAGYLGRKVAIPESAMWHSQFELWIQRWGPWAIFVLAFQPVLPFDVSGLIAGAAKMPLRRFWPALLAGRFPKYLIFAYAGAGIIHHLPFFNIR
jgi:uncharacterized membrane protein YdjX (TVP38/TMEM64 family)